MINDLQEIKQYINHLNIHSNLEGNSRLNNINLMLWYQILENFLNVDNKVESTLNSISFNKLISCTHKTWVYKYIPSIMFNCMNMIFYHLNLYKNDAQIFRERD